MGGLKVKLAKCLQLAQRKLGRNACSHPAEGGYEGSTYALCDTVRLLVHGTCIDTLLAANGCASILYTTLKVLPTYATGHQQVPYTFSYDINLSSLAAASRFRGGPEISVIFTHKRKRKIRHRKRMKCPRF